MPAYLIDLRKFIVSKIYKNSGNANYDFTDNYAPDPLINAKYKLIRSEDELYDFWLDANVEKFYEGTGISEDMKHEMFKEWIEESKPFHYKDPYE